MPFQRRRDFRFFAQQLCLFFLRFATLRHAIFRRTMLLRCYFLSSIFFISRDAFPQSLASYYSFLPFEVLHFSLKLFIDVFLPNALLFFLFRFPIFSAGNALISVRPVFHATVMIRQVFVRFEDDFRKRRLTFCSSVAFSSSSAHFQFFIDAGAAIS